MEQKKIQGQDWESQVKQTALLASPIYIGQVQGEEKEDKKGAKTEPLSFFGLAHPPSSRMYFPLFTK